MTSVIVVDDDPDVLEISQEFLELKGFEVVGCGKNGLDAVQLYRELKPDVILLDIMMPEYDGFYGLENIRKIDSKAKIIVVTGDFTKETEKKLEDLNPNQVLHKPYNIAGITECINAVLGKEQLVAK